MRRVLSVLCLSAALAACGSSSNAGNPVQACQSFTSAACTRFFACDATAAADAFGTVANCNTQLQNEAGCSTAACPSGKTFNSGQAQTCLNDYTNQTCADSENGVTPPSCNTVCQ